MLYNEPHPLEVRVLTKRMREPGYNGSIDAYLKYGGYKQFLKSVEMTPEQVIEELKVSNLRGRGGAGFPTGLKWSFVPRQSPKPKYIVVNGDESEPGTCKDRVLIENDPHMLIEGTMIGARVFGAERGYIYIRGEYRYLISIMEKAIEEAYREGWLGDNIKGTGINFHLRAHSGAGAYECGEESALLESLEGKRGNPRIRPPFPAVAGLYQSPTILNNVETYCSVPSVLELGGQAYADLGIPKAGGTKMTCLSGHFNKRGVYELPLGFPVEKLINEVGGGVRNGNKMKAFIPGGSSCPTLTGEEAWPLTMDYDSMAKAGTMLGSGGVVLLDETTDMVKAALRIMSFYAHESCGWCIPCREGTAWLKKLLYRLDTGHGNTQDINLVGDLAQNMMGRTFCPLGDAAAMPTIAIVKKFRHEFEAKLAQSTAGAVASPDQLVTIS